MGSLKKKFTFFRPQYMLDFNGWSVQGNFLEWNYNITGYDGRTVAAISKEIFHFTDTYVIDVINPADALCALMFTLAIDAEKCSRGDS